ncbi:hypothetical protein ANN_20536 [Periplaneta americana]|uniref:Uncharacterized protein n=1 Tax=Periplaneta americana TaxID=6978 RepID=A0ABQ8SD65_PERAM|nr:hypothetical protein ANN_20536 [Periplaneta americana]
MAGLCEGGNEPSGSLKAILSYSSSNFGAFRESVFSIGRTCVCTSFPAIPKQVHTHRNENEQTRLTISSTGTHRTIVYDTKLSQMYDPDRTVGNTVSFKILKKRLHVSEGIEMKQKSVHNFFTEYHRTPVVEGGFRFLIVDPKILEKIGKVAKNYTSIVDVVRNAKSDVTDNSGEPYSFLGIRRRLARATTVVFDDVKADIFIVATGVLISALKGVLALVIIFWAAINITIRIINTVYSVIKAIIF